MKEPNREPDREAAPRRTRPPRHDWESAVEKQIREAIERGDFDNLPGRGKPLDLSRDPNTPEEWELAFKLLKDAGFAPDWIELDKELRAGREKLFRPLQNYLSLAPDDAQERAAREARLIANFRKEAAELNRAIDVFNLKAPNARLHRPRIRIEEEIARFRQACSEIQ